MEDRGSISGNGNDEIFLFATATRPAVEPTHAPIQWTPGAFLPRVKRPGREVSHSPPSSAEVKE